MNGTIRADLAHLIDAAIDAVRPETLLPRRIAAHGRELLLDGEPCAEAVRPHGRIVVVGCGKAAAGMAAALEGVLAPAIAEGCDVRGLVSVPEGCGRPLDRVEVCETRPAGSNLPTDAVVRATRRMRALLSGLGPEDVAIVVVSGGGSALLEDPAPGVTLDDLIAVTQCLSKAGADIRELNLVRQSLSGVKAGGLARSCRAGRLVAVVLSDVIGDPLDLIASGPCRPVLADPAAALAILGRSECLGVAPAVVRHLERQAAAATTVPPSTSASEWTTPVGCRVSHVLLGSNATAVAAAAQAAASRGYEVSVRHAVAESETADAVGQRLSSEARRIAAATSCDGRPRAVIEGGEAVVAVPRDHGLGGRNQQTVIAAVADWNGAWPAGLALASIGTDGEDGPTDATGGLADNDVVAKLRASGLDLARAVSRCDAYTALDRAGGLIRTGPTGTNVADVRILLVHP